MSLGTALCWIAWFFVIRNIDPSSGGLLGFTFFYLSLFLAVVGTFSVGGFLFRRAIMKKDEIVFRHVRHTFRQSIIVGILAVFALFLLGARLLTWWNGLLLVALLLIFEGIIFTKRKYRNVDYVKN